jgi:hypothetical protein
MLNYSHPARRPDAAENLKDLPIMNRTNVNERGGTTLLGLLIALGLIIGGWILGVEIKNTRLADRYVTVKGLVERNVKSDLAIWPLTTKKLAMTSPPSTPKPKPTRKSFSIFSSSKPSSPTKLN